MFQQAMAKHPQVRIQQEVGESSWFGFSLAVREELGYSRNQLLVALNDLGFETRPIVAGDFTKNEVLKYFDYEIFGEMQNADYIDRNGLFVGNHHYDLEEAINVLSSLRLD